MGRRIVVTQADRVKGESHHGMMSTKQKVQRSIIQKPFHP